MRLAPVLLAVAASAAVACDRARPSAVARAADAGAAPVATRPGPSNIHKADYVGPVVCAECHAEKFASWRRSLHASMNQRADGAIELILAGDFDDAELAYGGGTARFTRDAEGQPLMELRAAGARAPRRFRVTRTIGTRYLQEYVGVEREGGGTADPASPGEIRLPFGWWRRPGGWFPQPYFDSWFGAEYDERGQPTFDVFAPDDAPWAARCAWCHNTYPFELRAVRASGARPLGQGLEQFFTLEASARPAEARRAIAEDNRLPVDELVTVGISCESCHLGGRLHAVAGEAVSFVPFADELTRRDDAPDLSRGRDDPAVVTTICAQCHSTPTLRWPSGAAQRNSNEALDFMRGGCVSQATCTDCHDPHVAGPGAGAQDQPRHVAACLGCHAWLVAPAAARAHTRHAPASVTCLDCHMPKIVQGVSGFTRTHHIESPAPAANLAAGAPNACNLCHLERSVRWTVAQLALGWGVRREAGGELDAPAGRTWLRSYDAATRLVAAAAFARAPQPVRRAAVPLLIEALDTPVAYERMFMLFALEDALGRHVPRDEFDPVATPAARAAQRVQLHNSVR